MSQCVTCGCELHPDRARKYNYCMARECQEKNAKGLTMVAVGVNKAAEQYLLLDEDTEAELASGKYHDQRRGSFGTSQASPGISPSPGTGPSPRTTSPAAGASPAARSGGAGRAAVRARSRTQAARAARPGAAAKARQPWTGKQARLALLYNEQGLRPEEIAQKLGLSGYAVTQIILTARNRGKL